MTRLATLFILLVIALHLGFMALEVLYWDHEIGRSVFSMTAEESASSAVLAANQGLYNGLLAVGLFWGLVARKRDLVIYILLFIIAAGVFGGMTAKQTILFTQALPAGVALAFYLAAPR